MNSMIGGIGKELRSHVPFTLFGALAGVAVLVVVSLARVSGELSHGVFAVAHPLHVMLSAMVTAGMYRLHGCRRWWATVIIGYVGSIGIATLSDSLIPYLGESMMGLRQASVHAGFIEEWYLVNPAALIGIAVAFYWPETKLPHAGHVFLSTFASLAHMIMAMAEPLKFWTTVQLGGFLFLAVWIPCCTSDIVFPLLFAKKAGSKET